jgi:hypothetical protein
MKNYFLILICLFTTNLLAQESIDNDNFISPEFIGGQEAYNDYLQIFNIPSKTN